MIGSFKLYVAKGKLYIAFPGYGMDNVTLEMVEAAVSNVAGADNFDRAVLEEALRKEGNTAVEVSAEAPQNLDGTCWVDLNAADGTAKVYLFPPEGAGRLVTEKEIWQELAKAGCGEFFLFEDIIKRNVDTSRKSKIPVVFKAAERRDAEIMIEISADKRTAAMGYNRPRGGKSLTLQEALDKIHAAGVNFGIDEQKVEEILTNNRDARGQKIARGKDPSNGSDAKIEYLFDAYHVKSGPHIGEHDIADFRDLNLFENVDVGAPLVQRIPTIPGEDGTDVTGKPIKANQGRDVQLPKGKNTQKSEEDDNLLVAASPGAPKLVGGQVIVEDVLSVGDVDFSTGNINFRGNVLVKGIVNTGFSIVADGDITCSDTVEGANLQAGGSIFLKRGIKGMDKSTIEAGRDIMARFIERCRVTANGSVIVDEALIHSNTCAADRVEATNSKGAIFGGVVKAGNLISAAFIGSEMTIRTDIEVGVAPHVREKLDFLNHEIKRKRFDYDRVSKNHSALIQMGEVRTLSDERRQLLESLGVATVQLKNEIEEMSTTIASLQEAMRQCAEGRVEARKMVYPGVTIVIKNATRRIRECMQNAVFVKEGPDIVLSTDLPD